MTKFTGPQMIADLAAHLRATRERIVWEDMQLGPSGSPRPDLYTICKSYTKPAPISYEVKISVADFRRDVTAGKWQKYLDFSCAVIFAVPAGLIRKEDIPAGCGLIVRSDAGWRMSKGPTLRPMPDIKRDVWMKLLIDGLEREACRQRTYSLQSLNSWRVQEEVRKKFGDSLADLIARWKRCTAEADYWVKLEEEEHERQMNRLRERHKAEIASAQSGFAQRESAASAARTEICSLLGLGVNADSYEIKSAARRLREQIDQTEEMRRCALVIKRIASAVSEFDADLLPMFREQKVADDLEAL